MPKRSSPCPVTAIETNHLCAVGWNMQEALLPLIALFGDKGGLTFQKLLLLGHLRISLARKDITSEGAGYLRQLVDAAKNVEDLKVLVKEIVPPSFFCGNDNMEISIYYWEQFQTILITDNTGVTPKWYIDNCVPPEHQNLCSLGPWKGR